MNDLVFSEWQTANRIAHRSEQEWARACLEALVTSGAWPPEELHHRAIKQRAIADDLFQAAMQQIEEARQRLVPKGTKA